MKEPVAVKISKIPISFVLGDKTIDGAVIKPLMFQPFVEFINEAYAMRQPAAFDARLRRIRMTKQVDYYVNGSIVPVSMIEVLQLPIPEARKIIAKLDDDEGKVGKIIRDGNGIDQAITYELAVPIPTGAGKEPIRELEFFAKTYGDIEDVLAMDNSLQQTAKLIETVARPLGTSLSVLPSWAINMITANDGIQISKDVLPRFLGSPDDSPNA